MFYSQAETNNDGSRDEVAEKSKVSVVRLLFITDSRAWL